MREGGKWSWFLLFSFVLFLFFFDSYFFPLFFFFCDKGREVGAGAGLFFEICL